jgi:B12-binding domain/radical SAM domain protein
MLSDDAFDVEKYLKGVDADIYGIDLHWLPHVHGAFNVARIIKRIHPDRKVVLGGFSSSYFAEDILASNEAVDYVMSGDLVEKQMNSLIDAVQKGSNLESVPNLVYRIEGKIVRNPPLRDPDPTAAEFINYQVLVKNSVKYHDIKGHLPFYSWITNPTGMTLVQHGCQLNCGFCGGSNFAYKNHYNFNSPLRRDPARVAEEIEVVQDTINSPVFIAGDINLMGEKFYVKLFEEIRNRGIDLPLLTEYFVPPGEDYYRTMTKFGPQFMCEISPDSSDQKIRSETGRYYSNEALEKSIDLASKYGSKKFDVYFSIGLPMQSKGDVLNDADYLENLISTHSSSDMPIFGFISPLTPFLDPGSLFYEMPDRYGFKITASKIMDYYNLLDRGNSWEDFLNYETKWMSKTELIEATYESGIRMVQVGNKVGYIQRIDKDRIIDNIMSYMNGGEYIPHEDKSKHLTYMVKELDWSRRHGVTAVSIAVFLYSLYERMRRSVVAQ